MNIIVVGCGRVGAELVYRLFQKGHKVTVVDQVAAAFSKLPADFLGRTIEGEALNQEVLHRAGIEHAQGLAAVTSSDTLNAVIAHIARSHYNIQNVVSRNFDPTYRSMHEAFGLQVIGSSSWGAQRIEELLYHSEMHTVFSAGNGEVELYEFAIPSGWAGRKVFDLVADSNSMPVSLTRVGRAVLPTPEMMFQEGDVLLVSATFDGVDEVRRRIKTGQEA